MDSFVGQGAAAADDANVSLFVDAAGHDADFAFAGRDDSWTVRTNKACFLEVHHRSDAHHIEGRNAFGDAASEWELRVRSLEDGVGSVLWGTENHRGVCAGGFSAFSAAFHNAPLQPCFSPFPPSHTPHNLS